MIQPYSMENILDLANLNEVDMLSLSPCFGNPNRNNSSVHTSRDALCQVQEVLAVISSRKEGIIICQGCEFSTVNS